MGTEPSKLPYFLAIIFGIGVFFVPHMEPFPIPLALIFLLGGGLFGFFWPGESWRWGLWITGPMIAVLALSVLSAGQLDVFVKKDLPMLIAALGASCLGSFIFARIKLRQKPSP